jgi:HAD superfamily hydrolase (TIGR01509 family)
MLEPAPTRSANDEARYRLARAKALLFDVDGTLAETEELHRAAFNAAFVALGLDWRWDCRIYKDLLRVAGGKERIRAFGRRHVPATAPSEGMIADLHRIKTASFAASMIAGACPLRPGVRRLLEMARGRGQRLALATTTTRSNIDALLVATLGRDWEDWFDAVVAGDEVPRKKPAPDVYLELLSRLDCPASACLAIEDSANGLLAAQRAGIACLITRSRYFHDDDFAGALAVVDDLSELI